MISIIMPVKDGGEPFQRALQTIGAQALAEPVEVVVVDSGSRDDSVAFARAQGATVIEIDPGEFGHGRTRNLGAEAANGEVLAFLSQDAVPVGTGWLGALTAGLEDTAVAGVYGRQVPGADAPPPERFFLDFLYGRESRRQQITSAADVSMDTALFSNVNSAIRRSAWERHPFADDLVMAEDGDWARRVLLDGGVLLYEPAAAVEHSHRYSLRSAFRRFFDSGAAAERNYLAGEGSSAVLRRAALQYARREMRWLARSGNARWIPYAALYEAAKFAGLQAGRRHARIPRRLRPRLSAHPDFWS